MKILLDECVPVRLANYIKNHEVSSVYKENWIGLKNGNLMKKAIETGFDIFLTADKNLQYQQNLHNYNITIVVFDVLFNRLQDFIPIIPVFVEKVPEMKKKEAYVIKN